MAVTRVGVDITENARGFITSINAKLGMPQKLIVERVLEWVAAQTPTVQQAVLGTLPDDTEVDAAKAALEQVIAKKPAGFVGKRAAHAKPASRGTSVE